VVGREDELWRVEVPGDALEFFETWARCAAPVIHRSADANDREAYQSIFAREKAPSRRPRKPSLRCALVAKLEAMGVGRAFVTLHVGLGLSATADGRSRCAQDARRTRLRERGDVEAVQRTRSRRTSHCGRYYRGEALESAAFHVGDQASVWAEPRGFRRPRPDIWSGETRLFIRPGFEFQLVDAWWTNFHLPNPRLMLVSAFGGREHVLAAYAHCCARAISIFQHGTQC